MKTVIICIGKIKEKYWMDAIADYSKRIDAYCKLEIIELPDDINNKRESERLLKLINSMDYVTALDIKGRKLSSEVFSFFYSDMINRGCNEIGFVIGGSEGFGSDIKNACDYLLSFSEMTFPYQMMRVILLEQIYRAWKIMRNEPYHK